MKKLVAYETEKIKQAKEYLNLLTVTGVKNCNIVSLIFQIMESGVSAEIEDSKKKEGD